MIIGRKLFFTPQAGLIAIVLISSLIFYKKGLFCRYCSYLAFMEKTSFQKTNPVYTNKCANITPLPSEQTRHFQNAPSINPNKILEKCNTSLCVPPNQLPSFQKKPPGFASDVLLLGYMRGGSTFIGEILGIRKNQFYVYEPLNKMAKHEYYKPGHVCSMLSTNCLISNESVTKSIDTIRAFYNCDQRTFKREISSWQLQKVKVSKFPKCEYREPLCWSQILKPCTTSSSRVIKDLRLTLGLASQLLDMLPQLKIIHLVRDPRAIIDSRLRGRENGKIKLDEIKSLCAKMRLDFKDYLNIQHKHPERIFRIVYEEIATNPLQVSRLYDFVGFSPGMDDFLHIHSLIKSSVTGDRFSTARKNSTATANKWRAHIPWNVLKMTDSECADVYDLLGYPQFKTKEDLLNDNIPLRT